MRTGVAPGDKPQIQEVREQRVTGVLISSLVGESDHLLRPHTLPRTLAFLDPKALNQLSIPGLIQGPSESPKVACLAPALPANPAS